MRKKIFSAAVALLIVQEAAAQDSLLTTTLQEVVVSASRSQQRIIDVPRSITVINKEAIEQSVYLSLGDLLSRQAGLYVVGASQTAGTNQTVFLRGANSNQVAVLIDGVRVADPSTPNSTVDLSELSLAEVEQIEIVEGSHSTLYGGAAVGGVINIITKKNHQKGVSGSVMVTGGGWKGGALFTESATVNFTGKSGVYANAAVMNQATGGLNASGESGYVGKGDADGFKKTDAFVKAGYRHQQWDVAIAYKKINQQAELDNGALADDDNAFLNFNRDRVDGAIAYTFHDRLKFSFTSSWSKSMRLSENDSSRIDADGNYDGSFLKDRYYGRLLTTEAQLNYTARKVSGVIGVGQFSERMWFNTYYFSNAFGFPYELRINYDSINTQTTSRYAFAQAKYSINDFSVVAGSRFTHHSRVGNWWTAELIPSYRWRKTMVYGSVSTGFNPASLYQLYDPSKSYGAITTRGNKDLESESSVSVEVGVKKEFAGASYVTIAAFRTDIRNVIEYVYLWNRETPVQELTYADYLGDTYLNITKQAIKGAEMSVYFTIQKFYLLANATWLSGKLSFNPSAIDTQVTGGNHVQLFNYGSFVDTESTVNKLVRRPQLTTNTEVGFKANKKITISMAHRYAGSRFDSGYDPALGPFGALAQFNVKAYHLTDVGAQVQITKSIVLALRFENIFDERYREIIGFETRGRTGYAKLQFKF